MRRGCVERGPQRMERAGKGVKECAGQGGGGWAGNRFREGGVPPLPPKHSGPDSTPNAFPYPNTGPNRTSNRQ